MNTLHAAHSIRRHRRIPIVLIVLGITAGVPTLAVAQTATAGNQLAIQGISVSADLDPRQLSARPYASPIPEAWIIGEPVPQPRAGRYARPVASAEVLEIADQPAQ